MNLPIFLSERGSYGDDESSPQMRCVSAGVVAERVWTIAHAAPGGYNSSPHDNTDTDSSTDGDSAHAHR
jgi:hypothetical protein